jgi:hypothetical protein
MECEQLPLEVVAHILSFAASHAELERMRRVSTGWRDLIDHIPALRGLYQSLLLSSPSMPDVLTLCGW